MAYIVKVRDRYCEWSPVVDAPISPLYTAADFVRYYQEEHPEVMGKLLERMARVDDKGTSAIFAKSAEDFIEGNRAGPGESCLTMDELYEQYAADYKD